ncbi:uncharacterized protein ACA1_097610 [Acanthamoeba castellanii str. Neff]|uniref:Uncharacterized protein n=1 Tax=Acanthamoeba castellanii (strain ATCC 30010 / Neff) TaxID=1257118 RepID=L8GJ49_ACACF|nr:uncharacterized protein ACA1_097610 [Acanthamoeba castellanii str. Neff]ELR13075.1 hypothetical protein ACA1_097610 [Acanthamoeba castellanii str. Neff]
MGVDECGLVIGNEVPASMLFCRDEALRVILVLLKDHGQCAPIHIHRLSAGACKEWEHACSDGLRDMAASMESNLVVDTEDKVQNESEKSRAKLNFFVKFARGAFPPSQFQ